MFDPKLVLPHDISPAKLASLPVDSEFFLAAVSSYMVIYFRNLKGKSTLLTDAIQMFHVAFLEEMLSEVSEIDEAIAGLTVS